MDLQRRKMALVREYKAARGCECGETDPVVLELHHRDPATKHSLLKQPKAGVKQRTYGYGRLSYAAIAVELEKCDVMCANCHRREEHRRRQDAGASRELAQIGGKA